MTNNDNNRWESYLQAGDSDNPPTATEICVLRQYVETFGTPNAVPVLEAAYDMMSLVQEITDMEEPIDKEERVAHLLWDVGLDMPKHQCAILMLVRKIPHAYIRRTHQKILDGWFRANMIEWLRMQRFWELWNMYLDVEPLFRPPSGASYPLPEFIRHTQGWLRHNTFYATNLALGSQNNPTEVNHEFTEIDRALMMITYTLENTPVVDDYPLPECTTLHCELQGLTPWFEISGRVLYGCIGSKDLECWTPIKSKGSNLWMRDLSLSLERWNFWKAQLDWMSIMGVVTRNQQGRDMLHRVQEKARALGRHIEEQARWD
ncbi:hypothetical protein N7535_006130 [Penicillium sp. DV-2018c]|nr:hypothetical protein N7461_007788 [Penicillium sp. DV-2018c]KAJ5566824.1 hypothetical protein N7535_006130 [Penicillium sp. DV-2018c]